MRTQIGTLAKTKEVKSIPGICLKIMKKVLNSAKARRVIEDCGEIVVEVIQKLNSVEGLVLIRVCHACLVVDKEFCFKFELQPLPNLRALQSQNVTHL
jgi:hypothetical protein